MDQLFSILTGLGVNSTIWIQLGLFLFTFIFINNVVFKRYQKAFEERHHKSLGGEDMMKQLVLETQDIQARYEKRARQVNAEIKSAYDSATSAAQKKQSEILDTTRREAADSIKKAREQITQQVREARSQLQRELPAISSLIASKLVGKES